MALPANPRGASRPRPARRTWFLATVLGTSVVALVGSRLAGHDLVALLTSDALVDPATVVLFVVAGVVHQRSGHRRRVGLLMMVVAVALAAEDLQVGTSGVVHSLALMLSAASNGPLAQLVLTFPDGRWRGTWSRPVTMVTYAVSLGLPVVGVALFPFVPRARGVVWGEVNQLLELVGTPLSIAVLVLLCHRWITGTRRERVVLGPLASTAILTATASLVMIVTGAVTNGANGEHVVHRIAVHVFRVGGLLIPVALLVGALLLRRQLTRTAGMLVRLGEARTPADLELLLRQGLGDPSLSLGLWDARLGLFRTVDGQPLAPGRTGQRGRVQTLITHGTTTVGLLEHDAAGLLTPEVLEAVAAGARLHASAHLATDGLAQMDRLERDLHDGVQADVVAALVALRLARSGTSTLVTEPQSALETAESALAQAITLLRQLTRGDRIDTREQPGPVAALHALADRSPGTLVVHTEGDLAWGPDADRLALACVQDALAAAALQHGSFPMTRVRLWTSARGAEVEIQVPGTPPVSEESDAPWPATAQVRAHGGDVRTTSDPTGVTTHLSLPIHNHRSSPRPSG